MQTVQLALSFLKMQRVQNVKKERLLIKGKWEGVPNILKLVATSQFLKQSATKILQKNI